MSTLYGPGPEEPDPLKPVSDLAGTPVDDVNQKPVGDTYGALADARHGLLRYLDVALYDSGRHVLVPIGHLRFEEHVGRTRARLQAATREELQKIEPYDPEAGPPDGPVQDALLAAHGALFHGERYYAHPAYDHAKLYAGETPIVTEEAIDEDLAAGPLARLSLLANYRVAPGEPDFRGWPVFAKDGGMAAVVSDLMVDPAAGKVRYAVLARPDQEEEALLPIGFLELNTDDEAVYSPMLTSEDIDELPPLPPGPLTHDYELLVRFTLERRLGGERLFDRPDFIAKEAGLR